jgi:hypothetical protein
MQTKQKEVKNVSGFSLECSKRKRNGPRFASFRFEADFFYETGTYRRLPSIYVALNINSFKTQLLAIFK